jgi:hypothetical protein
MSYERMPIENPIPFWCRLKAKPVCNQKITVMEIRLRVGGGRARRPEPDSERSKR